jgi:hypothetical protein
MKRSLIAFAIVATSATMPVQAQSFVAETIGGITGAVLCSQIGGGNGRAIATAGCAVVGAQIGRRLSTPSQPVVQGPPPVYYPQQQPQVIYQQPIQDNCMTDGYYKGEYNPAAARAYCRGAIEAQRRAQIRAEQNAYEEGRRAQIYAERDAYQQGAVRWSGGFTN